MHNGFGSGARKREGEAKRDLRRDERSDGGEGADDDTERERTPERRVTALERESGHWGGGLGHPRLGHRGGFAQYLGSKFDSPPGELAMAAGKSGGGFGIKFGN